MIHRTGKRASHTIEKYSVAIQAVEMDNKEEDAKNLESNDHAVSISVGLFEIGINVDGEKNRTRQNLSYPLQNLKSMLERLWKEGQSSFLCV